MVNRMIYMHNMSMENDTNDNLQTIKTDEQTMSSTDKDNIIFVEDSIYNMALKPTPR